MTSYLEIYHNYQREISKRSASPFFRSWSKMSAIRSTASNLRVPAMDVFNIVNREENALKW